MKKLMILIAVAVLISACYQETKGYLEGDANVDTAADSTEDGPHICDNGADDDGDGLADCADTDGDEDCSGYSSCLDASTDTIEDTSEDSASDVPENMCTNVVDDDGDGLADCADDDGPEDCSDDPACTGMDASTDTVEDVPEDTVEDVPADVPEDTVADPIEDTVVDTSVDTAVDTTADTSVDTVVDTAADEVVCTPVPGEVVLTWSTPGMVWDVMRAECYVVGTYDTLERWHDGSWSPPDHEAWNTIGGLGDAEATDAWQVSRTLSFAPGVEAYCNFYAFNSVDGSISVDEYAVGQWPTGTIVEYGEVVAISGDCDVTDLVVAELSGGGANYHLILP